MEVYRSDEEQLEALKKWWNENGRSVIFGIVIGVSVVVGWGAWKSYNTTTAEQASDLFDQLLQAVEEKKSDSALKLSERLIEKYGGSSYAVYANFFLAKLQLEKNEPEPARQALNSILTGDADENYKHIARLRLIRVLAIDGAAESGLKMIADVNLARSGEFEGSYEELRGDLYRILKKENEARASYQRAQQLGTSSPYIQLKLDDLAAAPIAELTE